MMSGARNAPQDAPRVAAPDPGRLGDLGHGFCPAAEQFVAPMVASAVSIVMHAGFEITNQSAWTRF